MSGENPKDLKNIFNQTVVRAIAKQILYSYPAFDSFQFCDSIMLALPSLELKARARCITEHLYHFLPKDYAIALDILLNSLTRFGDKPLHDWGDFKYLPFLNYIEYYGLHDQTRSLNALRLMTCYFSGEFAVRPFLIHHPKQTLAALYEFATNNDARVRRLASEGARPRLPWGMRLQAFVKDPTPVIPLLNILYRDENEVVRRSVANHLNDISKDHEEIALEIAMGWIATNDTTHTRQLVSHGLRGLRKKGNPKACAFLNIAHDVAVDLVSFELLTSSIQMGEKLAFSIIFKILEPVSSQVVVQYKIHFCQKNGQYGSQIFKLVSRFITIGAVIKLEKSHHFKLISTRKYYTGVHKIEIIIAGLTCASDTFMLNVPSKEGKTQP
jgi:3-methyladenine DNA glycosylase AlkC